MALTIIIEFFFYSTTFTSPMTLESTTIHTKIWCCWLLRDACQCQCLKALGFCVMWCSNVMRSNFLYKSKLFKTYLNYVDYGDGIVYSPIHCTTWTTTITFDIWMSITIFNIFTFMIDIIMLNECLCFCHIRIGLLEVLNTFGVTLIEQMKYLSPLTLNSQTRS